jgi:hypothetical protein
LIDGGVFRRDLHATIHISHALTMSVVTK